jgi:hypothetical protein
MGTVWGDRPSPVTVQASVGIPASGANVARAIYLHTVLMDASQPWFQWLEKGSPTKNADQFFLWKLIDETLKRRADGGAWAHVDKNFIPDIATLTKVLDASKFDAFGAQITKNRQPIEDSAKDLVTLLETEELLTEFNAYGDGWRWKYASDLLDGLADSHVGMAYLRRSVRMSAVLTPVIHPDQLIKNTKSFTGADGVQDFKTARDWLKFAFKLMPLLMADPDRQAFDEMSFEYIRRFFPTIVWQGAETLDDRVSLCQSWLNTQESNRAWWTEAESVFGLASAVLEIVNVGVALYKYADKSNWANMAGFVKALASMTKTVSKFASAAYGEDYFLVLGKTAGKVVTRFAAFYDVVTAAVELFASADSIHTGDYSVAAGHALQGVGLALGAADAVGLLSVFLTVPGVQIVAVAALAAVVIGYLLVEYTKDSLFETWLQNCWFGNGWPDLKVNEGPGTPMFRTMNPDHTPNLGRQICYWYSIFNPMRLTCQWTFDGKIEVQCRPTLAYQGSYVTVNRVDDDEGPWDSTQFYANDVDATGPGIHRLYSTQPGDDHLTIWIGTFGPDRWSLGRGANYDLSGKWIEVEMTMPIDKADEATRAVLGQHIDSLPVVTRARYQVPAK